MSVALVYLGCHNKAYTLGDINFGNAFLTGTRSLKSRGQQGCFFLRSLLLACLWPSSPCVFTWSSFCELSVSSFFLLVGHQSDWMSTCPQDLIKDPLSRYPHILSYCGLELQHMNLGRDTVHVHHEHWLHRFLPLLCCRLPE